MVSFLEQFGVVEPQQTVSTGPEPVSVGHVRVTDLQKARAEGEVGMRISIERAERTDALFAAKARAAILNHLRVVKEASGEELVRIARAHGALPPDDRAFGGIFYGLSRKGLIKTVGYCLREKGHGTSGGRIWARCS